MHKRAMKTMLPCFPQSKTSLSGLSPFLLSPSPPYAPTHPRLATSACYASGSSTTTAAPCLQTPPHVCIPQHPHFNHSCLCKTNNASRHPPQPPSLPPAALPVRPTLLHPHPSSQPGVTNLPPPIPAQLLPAALNSPFLRTHPPTLV